METDSRWYQDLVADHEARQACKLRRLARMGAVVTATTADYPREAERHAEPSPESLRYGCIEDVPRLH
jgi:hypothetical protein